MERLLAAAAALVAVLLSAHVSPDRPGTARRPDAGREDLELPDAILDPAALPGPGPEAGEKTSRGGEEPPTPDPPPRRFSEPGGGEWPLPHWANGRTTRWKCSAGTSFFLNRGLFDNI